MVLVSLVGLTVVVKQEIVYTGRLALSWVRTRCRALIQSLNQLLLPCISPDVGVPTCVCLGPGGLLMLCDIIIIPLPVMTGMRVVGLNSDCLGLLALSILRCACCVNCGCALGVRDIGELLHFSIQRSLS